MLSFSWHYKIPTFDDDAPRLNNVIIWRHRDAFTRPLDHSRCRQPFFEHPCDVYWPNRVSSPATLNSGVFRLFSLVFRVLHAWSDFIIRQRAPQWNQFPLRAMVRSCSSVEILNRLDVWQSLNTQWLCMQCPTHTETCCDGRIPHSLFVNYLYISKK